MNVSRHSTLLGLALEGRRMTAVVARRVGRTVKVRQTVRAALSLDPLSDDPELVGREIRNQLDGAGIRERNCVVCVPLNWALTLRIDLPDIADLSEEDIESFITVQAEREFPFAPEDLSIAVSRYSEPGGRGHATLAAIPANHLAVLQSVLKEANLRTVSITLGVTSFVDEMSHTGRTAMLVSDQGLDLEVVAGGGIVALRSLDEAVDIEHDNVEFDVELIARQLRITMGQLPETLRESVRSVAVYGARQRVDALLREMTGTVSSQEISLTRGSTPNIEDGDDRARTSPAAASAVAKVMLDGRSTLEFLPPYVSRIKRIAGKVSSRGTLWLAATAGVVAVALTAMFAVQHVRLARLESAWAEIEPTVQEVDGLQEKIRKFRPWFDDSIQTLSVARKLTEAFPEEGTVWTKSISIKKDLTEVTCTGYAKSDREWLDVLDKIRATKGIGEVQVTQIQGDSPLRFTFNFQWDQGEAE
jgi:hypothetical protein